MRLWERIFCIVLVSVIAVSAYAGHKADNDILAQEFKRGRTTMYQDMIRAGGGQEGSILYVSTPEKPPIAHHVAVCVACHHNRGRR
jgi:hypothetical protein